MNTILIAVIIVGAIGLIAGVGLAVASDVFAVPKDEKAEAITEMLPGANCGACGYSGCAGYAAAISKGDAKNGLCIPGGNDTAKAVAEYLGEDAADVAAVSAVVHCVGNYDNTSDRIEYSGVHSCAAAMQLFGGVASCAFGCVGLGDCASVCDYGAIDVCNGVARVNRTLCRGCGKCVNACPKGIISMAPADVVFVACSSRVKGNETRKVCKAGCLGCMKCVKACEHGAVTVTDFCASIDPDKCTRCGKCESVCPAKIIKVR